MKLSPKQFGFLAKAGGAVRDTKRAARQVVRGALGGIKTGRSTIAKEDGRTITMRKTLRGSFRAGHQGGQIFHEAAGAIQHVGAMGSDKRELLGGVVGAATGGVGAYGQIRQKIDRSKQPGRKLTKGERGSVGLVALGGAQVGSSLAGRSRAAKSATHNMKGAAENVRRTADSMKQGFKGFKRSMTPRSRRGPLGLLR